MNKEVLVIGGGTAGLEAAYQLKILGYKTYIIEKSGSLGGHLLKWDKLFPDYVLASDILEQQINAIKEVSVFLNTEIVSVNRANDVFAVLLSNNQIITVSAIIVATGFSLFAAEKKEEYGYGVYNRVITNADLENYFKNNSDNRIANPEKIGFVHCVGSRDEKICNRHCSKLCCVTAIKQACELKEIFPKSEVYCFYMDLRMYGRFYEDLYLEAQSKYSIRFIRGRVSEVSENETGRLVIKAEDTLASKPLKVTLDLLVLMAGMVHNSDNENISNLLNIRVGEDGFFNPSNPFLKSTEGESKGIFFAGACTGPKTIPESIIEAKASALAIHNFLSNKV